ncbi:Uracil-DNA glycosylase-like [Syntrophomonas zehnderi OL-4]|uniref:Type-4 uracil-DNA glycosylase n=1 Tax=Syntrophomonas zehnderi OL-4 TaxID=690567 RepID=A0A0E4GCT5_9FIRM|nr:uracil-DNA glycosylase [Syntrophomonas zehnderi]CFX90245.1 Uracil-DNA glycosylase-like [Syntrophomonas zehnderi OL-4]
MSIEQYGLFDDEEQAVGQKQSKVADTTPDRFLLPFIPGVKADEAYLDLQDLAGLKNCALGCSACRLRPGCKQVVFGDGNPESLIMFVGEGPGSDEDEQGIPFVGRAGQLLNKILAAAEFEREDVYITNVIKCRPPGNRLPNPDEVNVCRNFLEAQIRIIRPRLVVCLGALAAQTVIDPRARIGQVRGKWFTRNGIKIMPTYHPAALLRNESYKRPTWEDFKIIRDEFQLLDK